MEAFVSGSQDTAIKIIIILVTTAICFTVGSWLLGWITRRVTARAYRNNLRQSELEKRQNTLRSLVVTLWRILVLSVGALAIALLFVSASTLTPIFASAGVLGVAVGFGAQNLVKDFLSGIFIISENQYRVGDVIEIDTFSGTVERIGARSTVLRDVDGNVHYFPNGMIQHVINKTMEYSMARLKLSLDPDTDIDKAAEIIDTVGDTMANDEAWSEKIIEAPHYVMTSDINPVAIELIVSGKVLPSSQWSVAAELRRRIHTALEKENIELALNATGATIMAGSASPRAKHRR